MSTHSAVALLHSRLKDAGYTVKILEPGQGASWVRAGDSGRVYGEEFHTDILTFDNEPTGRQQANAVMDQVYREIASRNLAKPLLITLRPFCADPQSVYGEVKWFVHAWVSLTPHPDKSFVKNTAGNIAHGILT